MIKVIRTICVCWRSSAPIAAPAIGEQQPVQQSFKVAQAAASCSQWKSICESRGPGCAAKFTACMKSGCWTEGAAYGGKTHCGLKKQ